MITAVAAIELPEQALASFCRKHRIIKLALFGSVLREDFDEDSDVDALVTFDPNARIGFLALARAQRELAELLHRPVDLAPESGLKPVIRQEILDSAEVVYAV